MGFTKCTGTNYFIMTLCCNLVNVSFTLRTDLAMEPNPGKAALRLFILFINHVEDTMLKRIKRRNVPSSGFGDGCDSQTQCLTRHVRVFSFRVIEKTRTVNDIHSIGLRFKRYSPDDKQ